jgi:hypothetical protein
VGAAHRDSQRVDPGGCDKGRGFGGVGSYPRSVRAVLAADLAELGLQEEAVLVGPVRGPLRGGDVVVVVAPPSR